ncbi:MAG TPA: hypothetical protein VM305_04900 [Candidatus Limnocylindrales bacterium]|nr:hypothetical protein [Candidatus Limnocylindrales bacterium]
MTEEDHSGPSVRQRGCGWLGCALVILLLGAIGAGLLAAGNALEPLADRYIWQPHDVVREYFAAHRRGDHDRARRFQCEGTTGLLDPYAPLGRQLGAPFVEDELPYPRSAGQVAIYYRAEQHGRRAQALLQREEAGWRICSFET